ncbi:MAG: cytochrome c [Pseudomonadota bacterium]|nr:cytochrome c [Pseudomonadota bacterium]
MIKISNTRALLTVTILLLVAFSQAFAKGDSKRGQQLSRDCAACHGADGNSPSPAFPIIAGQHEQYIYSALQAYRDRRRDNAIMSATIIGLSDQQLQDLAAWFSSQSGLGVSSSNAIDLNAVETASGALLAEGGSDVRQKFAALPDESQCPSNFSDEDTDGDGLQDQFDAAPKDSDEFVLDTNGDGRFEICNIQQLQAILTFREGIENLSSSLSLEKRMSRDYELVRDIDASSIKKFLPIGNCGPTGNCMKAFDEFGFKGSFDGRGHVISNLKINAPESGGVGLFGVISRGKMVRNIEIRNADVLGSAGTGSVVGVNFGTIFNCHVTGKVQGMNAIGGLVGANAGNISYSHASVKVIGKFAVGGLVGDQNKNIFSSYATGDVKGEQGVGGLVGLNTRGRVVSSYASGDVNGDENVGGLVGVNTDALLTNSYASGSVIGTKVNAGALVGFNSNSRIVNAYSIGSVEGNTAVGGITGTNNGLVFQAYAIGAVKGNLDVGGVVGKNAEGDIRSSYWDSMTTSQMQPSGTIEGDLSGAKELQIEALSLLKDNDSTWLDTLKADASPDDYYCDTDGSGKVETFEQNEQNFSWDLRLSSQLPALRCTPGGVFQQHR